MKNPITSIILPIYNEEGKISDCLQSIASQDIDPSEIEVLIVDDCSTDKSLAKVMEFADTLPIRVLKNGKRDYDVGKAIGINDAKGEFYLFLDADNRLTDKGWIQQAIDVLKTTPTVVGVQSWKFEYSANHNAAVRYADLFGNTDPLVYYLGYQDHLACYKSRWDLDGKVCRETDEYLLVKFQPHEVPTLGSQGFMTRSQYFDKPINTLQHIEFCIELLSKPDSTFCFLKNTVEHIGSDSFKDLIKKLSRNIDHYLTDARSSKQKRYSLSVYKSIKAVLITQTIVIPLLDSIRGFVKKIDYVWFIHPVLCVIIPWIYGYRILKAIILKM